MYINLSAIFFTPLDPWFKVKSFQIYLDRLNKTKDCIISLHLKIHNSIASKTIIVHFLIDLLSNNNLDNFLAAKINKYFLFPARTGPGRLTAANQWQVFYNNFCFYVSFLICIIAFIIVCCRINSFFLK